MSLHTFYNEVGARVANLRGEIWRTYGDNELNKPERDWERADDYLALHPPRGKSVDEDFLAERPTEMTLKYRKAAQAVAQSLWEVWSAFEKARTGDTSTIMDHLLEEGEYGRPIPGLMALPVLEIIPVPKRKSDRPLKYVKLFPVLTMIPIPFGTTDLETLEAPPEKIQALQKVTQLIPNRDFVRTRVANSLMFMWGTNFVENRGGNLGVRLGLGGFFYSYRDLEDKTGSVDHWLGWTISYIVGPGNPQRDTFHRLKLGPQYNMDIWVSRKRYLGMYSYLEAGVDYRHGDANFLFAPSIGLQLGSLIGWDNYTLPDYLRIPLQLILPVKGVVTYNIIDGLKPEPSFAIEVDLLF
jgi:hypothetical protein